MSKTFLGICLLGLMVAQVPSAYAAKTAAEIETFQKALNGTWVDIFDCQPDGPNGSIQAIFRISGNQIEGTDQVFSDPNCAGIPTELAEVDEFMFFDVLDGDTSESDSFQVDITTFDRGKRKLFGLASIQAGGSQLYFGKGVGRTPSDRPAIIDRSRYLVKK